MSGSLSFHSRLVLALILCLAAPFAAAQAPGAPRGGRGGGGTGRNLLGVVTSISEKELIFRRQGGRGLTEIVVPLEKATPVRKLKPMKLGDVKEPSWARVRSVAGNADNADSLAATMITISPKLPENSEGGTLLGITSGVLTVSGETTATLKSAGKSLRLIVDAQTLVYGETEAKLSDLKPGDNVMINPKAAADSIGADSVFILPEGDLPAIGGRRGQGGRGGRGGFGGPGGRGRNQAPPINSIENLV